MSSLEELEIRQGPDSRSRTASGLCVVILLISYKLVGFHLPIRSVGVGHVRWVDLARHASRPIEGGLQIGFSKVKCSLVDFPVEITISRLYSSSLMM